MTTYSALVERSLLALKGADAAKFLNGLTTIDTVKLVPGDCRYGLILTPQGKFLHDFFIYALPDALWLDVDAAHAEALKLLLTRYRLRAQVEISRLEGYGIFSMPDAEWKPDEAPPGILCVPDPRLKGMGFRLAGNAHDVRVWLEEQGINTVAHDAYDRRRVALALPEGHRDMIAEKTLPMEFGMDALNAIDFGKGCYVGQEVTARSKFRAQLRKRVYRIVSTQNELPDAGTPLLMADKEIGELSSVSGKEGLARLPVEAAENARAGKEKIYAGQQAVMPGIPEWALGLDYSAGAESAG